MVVEGKLFSYEENFRNYKVLIAAGYGGHKIELDADFELGSTDRSEKFLEKFPLGKVPAVQLKDGACLSESNSAAFFLAPTQLKSGHDLLGEAEVLKWMFISETDLTPAVCNWIFPMIGILPQSKDQVRGETDTMKFIAMLNEELKSKTWLVGERITLADICIAVVFNLVFKFRKEVADKYPHFKRWYTTVINQKEVKAVLDKYPGVDVESRSLVQEPAAGQFIHPECGAHACFSPHVLICS